MGKRSSFERVERDFYPTPYAAVIPLLSHLKIKSRFCEPCAGDGALIDHLTRHGHKCASAWDIEPQREGIDRQDALTRLIGNVDYFITNPPWSREILHPLIEHLVSQNPTWLLFDADWCHTRQAAPLHGFCLMLTGATPGKPPPTWLLFDADWCHTRQAAPYMDFCVKIVSIGRVKWIPNSKMTGKDNCCWYLFDKYHNGITEFYGRT